MNIHQITLLALTTSETGVPKLDSDAVIFGALNIAYFIAGIIAVIVIIIAGFTFVTSGSDPGAVTKAKNAILYAIIGIVVILSAFAITAFVRGSVK
jgi:Type IV secretion system pilin